MKRRSGVGSVIVGLVLAGSMALSAPASAGCPGPEIFTADGCKPRSAVERKLEGIIKTVREENGGKATIAKIRIGNSNLIRKAIGQSQTGVPATPGMNFRIGSIAIPDLVNVLLQLQDRGRLKLNDHLSRWFPGLPKADQITLKMLANNTSGYYDFIQGNPAFQDLLYQNVFRQWTPEELLEIGLARGFACDPGTCFHYAHTNYLVLSNLVSTITGKTTRRLIQRRVLNPLGLEQTKISRLAPMPEPVLHSYGSDRGPYEDQTFWSPSWALGAGTLLTSTVDDLVKAARPIFTGKFLSRRSRHQMFALDPIGGQTRDRYYSLGLIGGNGWRLQNPLFNGWTAITSYLPHRRLTIVVAATVREKASKAGTNLSQETFVRLAEYLAPARPSPLSGPAPGAR